MCRAMLARDVRRPVGKSRQSKKTERRPLPAAEMCFFDSTLGHCVYRLRSCHCGMFVERQGATTGFATVMRVSRTALLSITTGPDRTLCFTNLCDNMIWWRATSGTATDYSIPTANSGPDEIANGSDLVLWSSESNGRKIGRVIENSPATLSRSIGRGSGHVWKSSPIASRFAKLRRRAA